MMKPSVFLTYSLLVAALGGCGGSPHPGAAEQQAQPPDAVQVALAEVAMRPPAVPSSVAAPAPASPPAHRPKTSGPHGQQDPHAALGPERLLKVALQHDAEGRLELALKTLAEGIARYPDAAPLYAVRASLRLARQQTSLALQDLEKAVALAPDDARIRVNRAQAYRAFGRFDAALEDLDIAVARQPDLLPARFNRGALRYADGDFERALSDFEHCIAVDPHAPAPYFNRASTYWQLGRGEEAMHDLERFLELVDNAEWKRAAEDLMTSWETALADRPAADKTDS
jgi:tetratricopeptide (TPR) repeat protein